MTLLSVPVIVAAPRDRARRASEGDRYPEDRAAVRDRCIGGAADQSDDQGGGMVRGHGFRPPPR